MLSYTSVFCDYQRHSSRQVDLAHQLLRGDYFLNEKPKGIELGDSVMNSSMLVQSMGVTQEGIGAWKT